jgi:hypothetical protein
VIAKLANKRKQIREIGVRAVWPDEPLDLVPLAPLAWCADDEGGRRLLLNGIAKALTERGIPVARAGRSGGQCKCASARATGVLEFPSALAEDLSRSRDRLNAAPERAALSAKKLFLSQKSYSAFL